MKKLLLILLMLYNINNYSQQVFYTEDNKNIANPERGLYKYSTGDSDSFQALNQNELINLRTVQKITLIWRCYYMPNFINSAITSDYLNKIQTDLNIARQSGVKLIIRFAYNESNLDASKSRILSHIDQLKPILNANQDVISSLEAGFIGEYGEWYDSSNHGNTDNLTTTQITNRIEIANKIFELCPQRHIAFRTPAIMRVTSGTNAMTIEQAYQGTNLSRTGYHNDCFLRTGWEGFTNTSVEYPYLEQQTNFTISGGESCGLIAPATNCSNALLTLKRFHFNYLNADYHQDVWANWQANSCKDEIIMRLGYRFVLLNSILNNNTLSINLINKGFGNVLNDRKAYLIYKNISTNQEYSRLLNTNVRFWQPTENATLVFTNLDTNLPQGSYRLYLHLPDNTLTNVAYSIRCANSNTWQESTGYNDLNQIWNNTSLGTNNPQPGDIFYGIYVYPNPIEQNYFYIKCDNLNTYSVKLYNMLGQKLNININYGDPNKITINKLKRGNYILKLTKNNQTKSYQLIK